MSRIYMRNIYHAHAYGAWGCKRGEGRQASGAPNTEGCDA